MNKPLGQTCLLCRMELFPAQSCPHVQFIRCSKPEVFGICSHSGCLKEGSNPHTSALQLSDSRQRQDASPTFQLPLVAA